jgi:hypothetical protein
MAEQLEKKVEEVIAKLGISIPKGCNPNYYFLRKSEGQSEGQITISKTTMIEMIQEFLRDGKSQRETSTFTGQSVDHETEPPNGYDYHSWERRSIEFYREDLVSLKIIDNEPKLCTKYIRDYDTGWRF